MEENYIPPWVLGKGRIDEVAFCQEFLQYRKMISVDGAFFTVDGRVTDEQRLRKEIYDQIAPFVTDGIKRKIDSLLETLRLECRREKLPYQQTRIHLANGTFLLGEGFTPEKGFCRYRLPVSYNADAPEPKTWLAFLNDLLEPEDILTLQEFMGYCLIPTTMGQKMLIITGRGGEGKSRIGVVMKALLGSNMSLGSLAKVESSPFARADLEHLLAMVDDDLKMEALNQTNYLKSIITAELPMDLERKGIQSYQGTLNVRFLAFGNGTLQALHDRSYGFFRRQIILSAKERDPNRVDDPYLGRKLQAEIEGIFLWCLEGLYRLVGSDFQFTISEKARANMLESMSEGNNIVDFMKSEGYIRFDSQGTAASKALYAVYKDWCEDNALSPLSARTFWSYLKQESQEYGLTTSNTISIGSGRKARGFRGIRICPRI